MTETALPRFEAALADHGRDGLERAEATTLQVNIGRRCDLACHHCHVEAGPKRTEAMDQRTAERVVELMRRSPEVRTLDLTGGAPELNPHFRTLVREARGLGCDVIDRCNLTVLFEAGQEDTAEFLAQAGVKIVASLPCYTRENVDAQRGKRVFARSIEALQKLGSLGYARPGSGLELDLVYNPLGPSLPPPQAELEQDYRKELRELFGIEFNRLITITNMPIKRFAHALARDGRDAEYMDLLVNAFNPETVDSLMCRSLVSVSWDGNLHDCDFHQILEIPLGNQPRTLWDIESLAELRGDPIATASHCFGCTAGSGSSCGGALA